MGSIGVTEALAPDGAPLDPTSVYRYYDRHGLLIYVGITKQGIGRNLQHNGKAEWWPYVVRQEVEHYPTRLAAARRERQLIHDNRPAFNKQHNAQHAELRAAYLRIINTPMPDESPAQQFHRLEHRIPFDVLTRREPELVLRTRLEHEPLASTLVLGEQKVHICAWGTGMRCGWVKRAAVLGSFAYLTCDVNKEFPQDVAEVTATLKFFTKPLQSTVLRLYVKKAEGPVVG